MKDVEWVEETRFLNYKVYISMGNNSDRVIAHADMHFVVQKKYFDQKS